MEQLIINDNFQLTLRRYIRSKAEYKMKEESDFLIHFFLDLGQYEFGKAVDKLSGLVLSIETSKELFIIPSQFSPSGRGLINRSIMLQILELWKVLSQPEVDIISVKVMIAALCSTAVHQKNPAGGALNFKEMENVYAVIQEWKEAKRRIGGTFNLYKPDDMSRKRFLHLVNELYGAPASELIYNLNMQKALSLLIFSDELIVSISELLGYTHKENFITAFRYTYGVTPGHLRRQFR